MGEVTNSIVIGGIPGPVFDLVTTARFWPQWHPATKAVYGVVERPYLLNDVVREQGVAMSVPFDTVWRITEHDRPRSINMYSAVTGVTITYTFEANPGGTLMTRKVRFEDAKMPPVFPSVSACEQAMSAESARALAQLKTLIEQLVAQESTSLSGPVQGAAQAAS
jgi:hypothetical protein